MNVIHKYIMFVDLTLLILHVNLPHATHHTEVNCNTKPVSIINRLLTCMHIFNGLYYNDLHGRPMATLKGSLVTLKNLEELE